jgi:hypothetical protein
VRVHGWSNPNASRYIPDVIPGLRDKFLNKLGPRELEINLKSARGLALSVPPTLLALADEVIE